MIHGNGNYNGSSSGFEEFEVSYDSSLFGIVQIWWSNQLFEVAGNLGLDFVVTGENIRVENMPIKTIYLLKTPI